MWLARATTSTLPPPRIDRIFGKAGYPIAAPAPKKKVKSIQVQGPWWQGGPGLEPPGFPPGINPQQGFNPLRQGFNPLQGINPLQQGFNPFQVFSPFQGFGINPLQQGFNPFQQGFNQFQGINPLQQGFNQFQGFNPNFGMPSCPSQGPAGNDSASESAEEEEEEEEAPAPVEPPPSAKRKKSAADSLKISSKAKSQAAPVLGRAPLPMWRPPKTVAPPPQTGLIGRQTGTPSYGHSDRAVRPPGMPPMMPPPPPRPPGSSTDGLEDTPRPPATPPPTLAPNLFTKAKVYAHTAQAQESTHTPLKKSIKNKNTFQDIFQNCQTYFPKILSKFVFELILLFIISFQQMSSTI